LTVFLNIIFCSEKNFKKGNIMDSEEKEGEDRGTETKGEKRFEMGAGKEFLKALKRKEEREKKKMEEEVVKKEEKTSERERPEEVKRKGSEENKKLMKKLGDEKKRREQRGKSVLGSIHASEGQSKGIAGANPPNVPGGGGPTAGFKRRGL
jgi:hypothetical protein